MNNYVVYKHTAPNGKSYIGITNNYEKRCYQHQKENSCRAFYDAIQTFGFNNFQHEILVDNLLKEDALKIEKQLIKKHNTIYPNGFNLKCGGEKTRFFSSKKEARSTNLYIISTVNSKGEICYFSDFENEFVYFVYIQCFAKTFENVLNAKKIIKKLIKLNTFFDYKIKAI